MADELMELEDKRRIELGLSIREQIARDMMKDGKVPEAQEDRDLLMKALDGMDRTILSRAKIKSDDAAAKANAHNTAAVTALLKSMGNVNRTTPRTELPTLPNHVKPTHIPGENHQGTQVFELEDIMNPGQQ